MERALSAPPREPMIDMRNGVPVGMAPNWEKFFAVLTAEVQKQRVYAATAAPGSIAANSVKAVVVACKGAKTGHVVTVNRTATHAGIGIGNSFVSAADQVTVEFMNVTGGAIDPGNQSLIIHLI